MGEKKKSGKKGCNERPISIIESSVGAKVVGHLRPRINPGNTDQGIPKGSYKEKVKDWNRALRQGTYHVLSDASLPYQAALMGKLFYKDFKTGILTNIRLAELDFNPLEPGTSSRQRFDDLPQTIEAVLNTLTENPKSHPDIR